MEKSEIEIKEKNLTHVSFRVTISKLGHKNFIYNTFK